jgi:5-methylcytosine-specific restriction protein A
MTATPKAEDFRTALAEILTSASALGFVAVDVNAGNLHRRIGGYPGSDHRMPQCCDVMRGEMSPADEVVTEPPSGQGASLTIRYRLPRR